MAYEQASCLVCCRAGKSNGMVKGSGARCEKKLYMQRGERFSFKQTSDLNDHSSWKFNIINDIILLLVTVFRFTNTFLVQ
jgi:hypothetical protein